MKSERQNVQLVEDSVIILTSPTGERGYRKVQEQLQQGQSRKQEAKVRVE